MEWIIRQATPEDAPALDLVMQVISDGPGDLPQAAKLIGKIAADPQKALLVAVDPETGTLCGSLLGVVFEDISGDCRPILLVENVAVLPEYQHRGVGRALFAAVEAWAKEYRCRYEILVSGLQRTGAHAFYRALGFNEIKGFKKYLGPDTD